MKCDRCGKEMTVHTMSYFNTDQICLECEEREISHPDYARAVETENEAVRRGEFNYPGIGLPVDLKHDAT